MISCRRAAELTSLELDTELSLGERVKLSVHRTLCGACRRMGQQFIQVDQATDAFLHLPPLEDAPEMPADTRARIQATLDMASNAE